MEQTTEQIPDRFLKADCTMPERIKSVLEWLFVLSVILTSGTMYGMLESFNSIGIDDFLFRIITLCLTVLLLCAQLAVCWKTDRPVMTKNSLRYLMISAGFLIVYILISRQRLNSYLESFAIPALLFSILAAVAGTGQLITGFMRKYTKIVLMISIVSLFFYLFGTILHWIPSTAIQYHNNGELNSGSTYLFLSFINDWQTQTIGSFTMVRNIGIFMEAPGFAFVLLLSLWWALYDPSENKKITITILVVTLITTISTTAYVLGILTVLFWSWQHAGKKAVALSKKQKLAVIGVVLTAVIIAGVFLYIKATGANSDSFVIRMGDTTSAFKTFLAHPLFGAGFYNREAVFANYPVSRSVGDPTNGIFNILAFHGIALMIWYLIGVSRLAVHVKGISSRKAMNAWLFLICFLGFTSPIQYNYTLLLFLGAGWSVSGAYSLYGLKPEMIPDEPKEKIETRYVTFEQLQSAVRLGWIWLAAVPVVLLVCGVAASKMSPIHTDIQMRLQASDFPGTVISLPADKPQESQPQTPDFEENEAEPQPSLDERVTELFSQLENPDISEPGDAEVMARLFQGDENGQAHAEIQENGQVLVSMRLHGKQNGEQAADRLVESLNKEAFERGLSFERIPVDPNSHMELSISYAPELSLKKSLIGFFAAAAAIDLALIAMILLYPDYFYQKKERHNLTKH